MVTPTLPANAGTPAGPIEPQDTLGQYNRDSFVILQWMAKMQTATLVKVMACTNNGGLSPFGYVDVLPLVNQIDGVGNPTPHETIYNIPYFRLQGGNNAVIIDPNVNDIGLCVFASRDISKVKATQAQANPGSYRTYDWADGLYVGGLLNGIPSQYVQFNNEGISLTSPVAVILNAPDVKINAATVEINGTTSVTMTTPTFNVNGAMNVSGDIIGQSVNLKTHTHSGVMTGSANTGPPV